VCTLALYQKVFPGFPILVAANRDERYDRPSAAPDFVGQAPIVLAGRDLRAGGTWLGINQHGLVIGILNRRTNTTPATNSTFRSRGLLCLDLLRLSSTNHVRISLRNVDPNGYQPFTVVCADHQGHALTASNVTREVLIEDLPHGLHVFSSSTEFDVQSNKADRAFGLFAKLCDNSSDELDAVQDVPRFAAVLSDHISDIASANSRDAVCVHGDVSGTVSSSIIFYSERARQMQSFYCAASPCQREFTRLADIEVK
jgi:uncharacterized protein with NRDE domain